MKVSVGISNRHVHLKEEHLKKLFGNNFHLEAVRTVNQPGQFASNAFVTLKTDKNKIEKVRVLGPARPYTQVEISKTDAYKLGLNPPIRSSGDLKDSCAITLIGPLDSIKLDEGCIIADRHIHINEEQALAFGLNNVDEVSVTIKSEKSAILQNVKLRVAPNSYFEMHLDTDDANATLIKNGDEAMINEEGN